MMILNKGLEQGSICLSGFGILEILGEKHINHQNQMGYYNHRLIKEDFVLVYG